MWPKEKSFAARTRGRIGIGLPHPAQPHRRRRAGDRPHRRHIAGAVLSSASRHTRSPPPCRWRKACTIRGRTSSAGAVPAEMLTPEHASLLAAVARTYGDQWMLDLIDSWDSGQRFGSGRTSWVADELTAVCEALHASEASDRRPCLRPRLAMALQQDRRLGTPQQPRATTVQPGRLGAAASPGGCSAANYDEMGASIVEALRSADDKIVEVLVPVLRAYHPPSTSALIAVARDCRDRLTRLVDSPVRARDDWSIEWTGCGCGECYPTGAVVPTDAIRAHPRMASGQARPPTRPPTDR